MIGKVKVTALNNCLLLFCFEKFESIRRIQRASANYTKPVLPSQHAKMLTVIDVYIAKLTVLRFVV